MMEESLDDAQEGKESFPADAASGGHRGGRGRIDEWGLRSRAADTLTGHGQKLEWGAPPALVIASMRHQAPRGGTRMRLCAGWRRGRGVVTTSGLGPLMYSAARRVNRAPTNVHSKPCCPRRQTSKMAHNICLVAYFDRVS